MKKLFCVIFSAVFLILQSGCFSAVLDDETVIGESYVDRNSEIRSEIREKNQRMTERIGVEYVGKTFQKTQVRDILLTAGLDVDLKNYKIFVKTYPDQSQMIWATKWIAGKIETDQTYCLDISDERLKEVSYLVIPDGYETEEEEKRLLARIARFEKTEEFQEAQPPDDVDIDRKCYRFSYRTGKLTFECDYSSEVKMGDDPSIMVPGSICVEVPEY